MSFNISRTFITLLIVSQFVTSNRRAIADIMECYRRYMAEILWIRRKTSINLSINHTRYRYFVQQNKNYLFITYFCIQFVINIFHEKQFQLGQLTGLSYMFLLQLNGQKWLSRLPYIQKSSEQRYQHQRGRFPEMSYLNNIDK